MTNLRRPAMLLPATLAVLSLAGTACTGRWMPSRRSATSTSTAPASGAATTPTAGSAESPSLESLVAEVQGSFEQLTYTDPQAGETLPYNLYAPPGYEPSKSYPLVLYIADSSLVGQDVKAPLSQYGALIWASSSEQAKHESLVLVPQYPSVILDDHNGYTMTDYVEMTARLVQSVEDSYRVDTTRVYGTGQSMGAMTVMYLAAEHPDLFAAELIVSGQWDVSVLGGLADEKFFYTAAGGDTRASGGQAEVEAMLTAAGVPYGTATWDATWSAAKTSQAAAELLAGGHDRNFVSFAAGTVMKANPGTNSEHMASFQPAYEITAIRDWLFQQAASSPVPASAPTATTCEPATDVEVAGVSASQAGQRAEAAWTDGDHATAMVWAEKAAEGGDTRGQRILGIIYLDGSCVAQDHARALLLLQEATGGGDMKAPRYLGQIYTEGLGVTADPAKAASYYETGVDRGDISSMIALGDLYVAGSGVSQDYAKALDLYRQAAERDDHVGAPAMTALGRMHEQGLGVTKDLTIAEEWYRKAIAAGDTSAQADLDRVLAEQ